MKTILHTQSMIWAESVRIALLAQGIEAVVLDTQSLAIGSGGGVRVALLHDGDLPGAEAVLRGLQPPKSEPLPFRKWQKWGLFALGATIVLIFVSRLVGDSPQLHFLSLVLYATSILLLVGGLLLAALGRRADKKRDEEGGSAV